MKETTANIHSSGKPLSPAVADLSLAAKLIHTEKIVIFIEHSALTAYETLYFLRFPSAFLTFGHIVHIRCYFPLTPPP